jgi:hypothetical protein
MMPTHLRKLFILGSVLCLAATPVLAQGRGNSGGNANANVGGQSGANMNAQGRANTNGPNATDRVFGQDRAAQRPDRVDAGASANANANGNSALGGLNASRASDNARANANSNSRVGEIGSYETDMRAALAMSNRTQRDAAITRARQQLAQTSNKPLTADAIAELDSNLNITGASPQLGASR